MVGVSGIDGLLQGSGLGGFGRISIAAFCRSAKEEIDGGADELDVAVFLSGDIRNQIEVGAQLFPSSEVEALEGVVHEGGHFPKFSAHQFLHSRGGIGIGTGRIREGHGEFIKSMDHSLDSSQDRGSWLCLFAARGVAHVEAGCALIRGRRIWVDGPRGAAIVGLVRDNEHPTDGAGIDLGGGRGSFCVNRSFWAGWSLPPVDK